jgi:hypothetical protein
MYHTTGNKFWGSEIKIIKGSSEFYGLYGAPDASLHFSRVNSGGYKIIPNVKDLFSGFESPGIAKIYSNFDIAEVSGPLNPGKAGSRKFIGELKPGTSYVTGIKPEIEAVIPIEVGNKNLKYAGSNEYFTYKGQRITIDEFRFQAPGESNINIKDTATGKRFGYKSYRQYEYPLYTPSTFYSSKILSSYSPKYSSRAYQSSTIKLSDSYDKYDPVNYKTNNYKFSYDLSKSMIKYNVNNIYNYNKYPEKNYQYSNNYQYMPLSYKTNLKEKGNKKADFDISFGSYSKSIAPRPSRKYRYTASLSAAVFGIKGKPNVFGKDKFGKIYGGGIRPIPIYSTKSRKTRKHKY